MTVGGILRNWGWVFRQLRRCAGGGLHDGLRLHHGLFHRTRPIGEKISHIGEDRTLGYAEFGAAGWATIFLRGMLCNWMVSMGVVGAMISTSVSGKVIAMWMPIMLFFFMGFEHSVVNMFLFLGDDHGRRLLGHGLHGLERDPHRAG